MGFIETSQESQDSIISACSYLPERFLFAYTFRGLCNIRLFLNNTREKYADMRSCTIGRSCTSIVITNEFGEERFRIPIARTITFESLSLSQVREKCETNEISRICHSCVWFEFNNQSRWIIYLRFELVQRRFLVEMKRVKRSGITCKLIKNLVFLTLWSYIDHSEIVAAKIYIYT